jgi:tRNA nucleotidyltransferase (CCA-adding enzyme)
MAVSRSDTGRGRIKEFFHKYNGMRPLIRGEDLKALGVKAGPHFGKIMERVLDKKLDGKLKSKEKEIEYAKKLVKRRL